ncbi:Phosphoglycolate phosphatase [Planctomycetes bacterium Pan216]|uniref:phosphoglycolate phosphatase n=1 Tax=Kolteria novifilia TaxID=2527975 RepID=A0A518BC77_9BACT|nr:Phosphoglycolate phosphatase [Planctomycetes bacterium Pan216]
MASSYVLFDIDGTLIRSGGAGEAAMREALRLEFGICGQLGDVDFHGRTDRSIGRDLLASHQLEDSAANWERFKSAYLSMLPSTLDERVGAVLPGVVGLLDHLSRNDDVVLGLITGNSREGARIKLRHFGLNDYFPLGAFGDDHWDRTALALDVKETLEGLVSSPIAEDRVWIVGDTPLDVACARVIGARAVAVATGKYSVDELAQSAPDVLAQDLSDHSVLLGQLHGP